LAQREKINPVSESVMRFVVCGAALLCCLAAGFSQEPAQPRPDPYAAHIAATPPRSPADEQRLFHLPPGFEIQLVAAEPDVKKPINIAFDAAGRLWVTQSVEYPFPVAPGARSRDAVKILDDFGPDGRAGRVTTFADNLNIPIGVLPIRGGALVYSIPSIYRMVERRASGQAGQRDVLYSAYGFKDTHGMTGEFRLGFDGWVYACHGFSNTSTVKAAHPKKGSDPLSSKGQTPFSGDQADGSAIQMRSGNTYRFKPDGSHIEYFTHGQVNPFGLAFDPLGNLYSCDCHSRPIYQLLRGAYYPSFGAPDDGLGFGPEMMRHDHGSTAIAGITYYAADHFPPAFRDNIFIGNVVTNRINRDRLERHGSSYKAIAMPDFVRCEDPWFRPVDLQLGPDGALYVADFYTRIIGHYEVPLTHPQRDHEHGRIWRIVYRGPDGQGKPWAPRTDWTRATPAELVGDLAHRNLAVRMTAMHQLVERGGQAGIREVLKVMHPGSDPFQRMHSLWVLAREDALPDEVLAAAALDHDPGVRVHALRVLIDRPALTALERQLVLTGLTDGDAYVRRAAAEVLGSHPATANLRPLLDLRYQVPADDTHLLHVVRMALRDQLRPPATWQQLPVATWSDRDARAIADVCTGVPSAEAAAFLLDHVRRFAEPAGTLTRYVRHVARYGADATVPALVDFLRSRPEADLGLHAALFKALQQGTQERGGKLSAAARDWGEGLIARLLGSRVNSQALAGIDLAGTLRSEAAQTRLADLARRKGAPEAQRRAAIVALAASDGRRHVGLIGQILNDAQEPAGLREQAASTLAGTNLPDAQAVLLQSLPAAPSRLQNAIAAGLAGSRQGADKLLAAVTAGKASARLLLERSVEVRLKQSKVANLNERLATLTQGLPRADEKLQQLLQKRRRAFLAARTDVTAGAKVFEQHCAACHQIHNQGARIGPQLDGIGVRGLDRILEDVLDPNRNVDQAFRATTLTLTTGQTLTGLVLREEGEVLVLADAQGKEVRVPRGRVEEKLVSQLSPMPANFAEQIPESEFNDLVAYLLAQREPPAVARPDGPAPSSIGPAGNAGGGDVKKQR
jgi:putative heme-binding domain-containing protein